tara:strand:+ start:4425 stop:4973 length:549 start_codon:yes stop_codon:yes gene_type:complete
MGLISQDKICGMGCSFGHRVGGLFNDVGAFAGFGDPYSQLDADVSVNNPEVTSELGIFHDEGGQVAVLFGEFFGEYHVRLGTQAMHDAGEYVVAYSGIAGLGQRCQSYLHNRRVSFVIPMGLPLGDIVVVALALQSVASPRSGTLHIVKRAHYSRLYQLASLFPTSYATNVATTVREEKIYD